MYFWVIAWLIMHHCGTQTHKHSATLQIQEECVVQIADELEDIIKPKALGVIMKASHMCMTLRGVREKDCDMTTSVMRGLFMENNNARSEFLNIIK